MTTQRTHGFNYPYWLLDYGIAIAGSVLALQLTIWLTQAVNFFESSFGTFALFYVVVLLTTLRGSRASYVAIAVSSLLIYRFLLLREEYFFHGASQVLAPLGLFWLGSTIIVLLIGRVQTSKRQVEQLNQKLQEESSDRLSMALSAAKMGLWDWNLNHG